MAEPIKNRKEAVDRMTEAVLAMLDPSMLEDRELLSDIKADLETWFSSHPEDREAFSRLSDPQRLQEILALYKESVESNEEAFSAFMESVNQSATPVRRIPRRIYYIAAAVAITAVVSSSILFRHVYQMQSQRSGIAVIAKIQDIQPGTTKAVLTLDNGREVALDSLARQAVIQQGRTRVVSQSGGQLAYQAGEGTVPGPSSEMTYNKLSTGRGGQYRLVLPDGTRVWLDAATTLRYPTAFSGSTREVELDGQAYFEVKHNSKPFIVHTAQTDVMDLGTAFNVNAYREEETVKTCLLAGSVRVGAGSQSAILTPGQEAVSRAQQAPRVGRAADTSQVIAWKNQLFQFNFENLPAIMRQISRWYDVQVTYEGTIPDDEFSAYISRNLPVSKVLHLLEQTKLVHFTIEGNKIIVRK